jgi:hypothetical protein
MTMSSSTTIVPSVFSVSINEKLTKSNYMLWHAQVMSAIRAAEFEGFLTGTEKVPIFASQDRRFEGRQGSGCAAAQPELLPMGSS